MKLPGVAFFREQAAVKAFESQDRSFRELVFYSEGAGDWPHLGPVIQALLRDHDRNISYLTSDTADPGLSIADPRFRAFAIGAGTARTVLFARIDCRDFVMTLPDVGNLWLKRSVHQVRYLYLFHSLNSTHTSYRTGAFDQFDTILCGGPHHVREIRRTEEVYGLRAKELVEHGSVKLDTLAREYEDAPPVQPGGDPSVLVAPTWGASSLIESEVGTEVIDTLLDAGFRTVLRLHPMTVRRLPAVVADLRRRYADRTGFDLEERMSATQSWLESSVMISDWSGAATEYALALGKPVAYIGTVQKIMNPEHGRIGLPAFEDTIRSELGQVVAPSDVDRLPDAIASLMKEFATTRQLAADVRARSVFNVAEAAEVGAAYLASAGTDR